MKIEWLHDTMVAAVAKAGGKTPFAITGNRPTGKQADMVFRADGAVAEVKLLAETQAGIEQLTSALYDTYNRWLFTYKETTLVTGRGHINTAELPRECAQQIMRIVGSRVQRDLVTSSKQILQTEVDFAMRSAKGIVIFVAPLGMPLDPEILMYAIGRTFADSLDWPAVDHVVLATCRVDEIDPDQRPPYWYTVTRQGQEPLPAAFEEKLRNAWFGVLSEHFGKAFRVNPSQVFAGFDA
jgi:hypothetical protein